MKKVMFLIAVVFSLSLQAQWIMIYNSRETNTGIFRHGNNYFWIEDGELYGSSYGSVLQFNDSVNPQSRSFYMSFSDADHGLLVVGKTVIFGYLRELYSTADAGKTWTKVFYPLPNGMEQYMPTYPIAQRDADHWLWQAEGALWQTSNAGKDWEKIRIQNDTSWSLEWSDKGNGILLSKNKSGFISFTDTVQCFLHYDLQTGTSDTFFFDDGKILKNDSGWMAYYVLGKVIKNPNGRWYLLFNEFIPSCGAMYNGSILLYSDDHGKTWKKINFKLENHFYEAPENLVFSGNDTAYVSSDNQIFRSTDGGKNWKAFTRIIPRIEKEYVRITGIYISGDVLLATTNKAALFAHSALNPDLSLSRRKITATSQVLFPNPVQNGASVFLKQESGLQKTIPVRIYNSMGTLVFHGEMCGNELPLPWLSPGNYALVISDSDNTSVKHFMVK